MLIITIAVIIILATAVILSIANNRPIDSAKEATASHNESVLLESAAVLSAQWKTDSLLGKTELSRSEYVKEGLKSQGFTEDEAESIVVDDETGETKRIEKGGALDVASNPDTYYGKEVDYKESSNSGVKWKIFYSDGKNIYLIASDYIPYANIPNSTNNGSSTQNKPDAYFSGSGGGQSVAYFKDIVNDYTGSESITDSKLQNLNSSYFAYLKSNKKTSTNNNMKAVAYMLDTKAWEIYAGENAEYAIGGPTSEIFIKSWNAKYPDQRIEYQVANENGYTYKKEGTNEWEAAIMSAFDERDSLYVIGSSLKAWGMWLASPSSYGEDYLNSVFYNDYLNYKAYENHRTGSGFGFRPLVCLNSSVKLQEQGSDKYIIK